MEEGGGVEEEGGDKMEGGDTMEEGGDTMEEEEEIRWTHRPADEEHGDRAHYWHVSNQRLQNHPHHAVQLRRGESYSQLPAKSNTIATGSNYLSTFLLCSALHTHTWIPFTPALQKYRFTSTSISTSPT